jgi:hypothetical protein
MKDPLYPLPSLLCKLASIAVHIEEGLDPKKQHPFDVTALKSVLNDAEVQEWMKAMTKLGLAPIKR